MMNQITTFSMSMDVPHLPWFIASAGNYKYQAATDAFPQGAAGQFLPSGADMLLPGRARCSRST